MIDLHYLAWCCVVAIVACLGLLSLLGLGVAVAMRGRRV